MKHLKKFNEGYQDLNQIEKIDLLKKLKYQCEKIYQMLHRDDIEIHEFSWRMLDEFKKMIPDFHWNMAERDLGDDIMRNYVTAPHLCASLINYMQEHPLYFSKSISKVNDHTGIFESLDSKLINVEETSFFENNATGAISKLADDLNEHAVSVLLAKNVIEFFKKHDMECTFKRFLSSTGSNNSISISMLEFIIGGVNVLLEHRDHLRVWNNPSDIEDVFFARSTFYDLASFIEFYNTENVGFLINSKLNKTTKLGVFSND